MLSQSIDKVFFCCVDIESAEAAAYQHATICLGEGLKELGIPIFANINYWSPSQESEDYLFRYDPEVTPEDCSIVVVSEDWFSEGNRFPQYLFHKNRSYKVVYLDRADGSKTRSWEPEFRQFDFIFKTHYNDKFRYPDNFYPWAFGLSNRIIEALNNSLLPEYRKKQLLVNFRHRQFMHSVRKSIYYDFLPYISGVLPVDDSTDSFANPSVGTDEYWLWMQTGRRHYNNYFQRLKGALACACFGGYFESAWPRDKASIIARSQKRILSYYGLKTHYVSQWDSWRFWESLMAGCVTFHLDFEKYGFVLPVMPTNWTHYVGIDLDNVQQAIERISDEPEILANVAIAGKEWALEHYSPVATALRFLKIVN